MEPKPPGFPTGPPPNQNRRHDNSSESWENDEEQRSQSGDKNVQRQRSGDRQGPRPRSGERSGQRQRSGDRGGQRSDSGDRGGRRQNSGDRSGNGQRSNNQGGRGQGLYNRGGRGQPQERWTNERQYDQGRNWQQQNFAPRGGYQGHNRGSYGHQGYHGGSYGPQDHYGYQQHGRQRGQDDNLVFLSRTLSSILRHNAEKFGFKLMKGGFLYVDEVIQYTKKLHGYTMEDVQYVVDNNDKKRFSLEQEAGGRWKIRANQGHSLEVEELDLKPILSADDFPKVVHGTYYEAWEAIKKTGLCRMNRNHIHFAAGEPGNNGVISGMRSSCEVMIYIDLDKAIKEGLKFFLSANNVILCPGNDQGFVFPCYFQGAVDRRNYYKLPFDASISFLKRPGASEADYENKKAKKKKNKKNKGKWENEASENWDDPSPQAGTSKQPDDDHFDYNPSEENVPEEAHPAKVEQPKRDASPDKKNLEPPKKKVSEEAHPAKVEQPKRDASPEKKNLEPPKKKEPVHWSDTRTLVEDVDACVSAVDHLLESNPAFVAVCCCGKDLGTEKSQLTALMVFAFPEIYQFQSKESMEALMNDGRLKELLMSRAITKVFHNIQQASFSLIREFDILMNSVPIWDISLILDKCTLSIIEKEQFQVEFGIKILDFMKKMKHLDKENTEMADKLIADPEDCDAVKTLIEQGKMIHKLYDICLSHITEEVEKKLKKETFAKAIPDKDHFLADKVEELKKATKAKGAIKEPATQGKDQQPQQQQSPKKQNQNQKGKKKKGK